LQNEGGNEFFKRQTTSSSFQVQNEDIDECNYSR
jgi:hypothetical protein